MSSRPTACKKDERLICGEQNFAECGLFPGRPPFHFLLEFHPSYRPRSTGHGPSNWSKTMKSAKFPLWLRFVLLVGVVGVVSGAGLLAYRYWTRPVTLSVAVGSIDGEAAKAMSAIASRLASNNASVRLNVVDSGTALGAAKAFSDGKVDLAVVRGDVGDLSKAQAVVVMTHVVALVLAPPGSPIDSMHNLKATPVRVR